MIAAILIGEGVFFARNMMILINYILTTEAVFTVNAIILIKESKKRINMIIHDVKQNSEEWYSLRLGRPTASNFSKIITSTGTPSASASTLMNELLAEWYVGKTVDQWEGNDWTIRGNELEPEARKLYSFITGNDVEEVGFCTMPGILTGASPDGLVSDSGLVEIKCPKASTMIKYMLANKLPTTYKQQVHGQLWVTGRKWCDFMAHHPDFEPFIIHVKRDDEYIKKLEASVLLFIKKMLVKRGDLDKLRA